MGLFKRSKSTQTSDVVTHIKPVDTKQPLKEVEVKRMYGRPSSFIDKLPW